MCTFTLLLLCYIFERKYKRMSFFLTPDLNIVLKQGMHKIDFKTQGVVELTVKPLNPKKVKDKPPVLPRPKIENLEHVRSMQATTDAQVRFFFYLSVSNSWCFVSGLLLVCRRIPIILLFQLGLLVLYPTGL